MHVEREHEEISQATWTGNARQIVGSHLQSLKSRQFGSVEVPTFYAITSGQGKGWEKENLVTNIQPVKKARVPDIKGREISDPEDHNFHINVAEQAKDNTIKTVSKIKNA